MSEASPRRVLHLVVDGFPTERLPALKSSARVDNEATEIFQLTEANAREALEKIFAADTIAVWGKL